MRPTTPLLSLLLLAAAARADDAPPPLADIAAAVRAREAATLPRGLTYDVDDAGAKSVDALWVSGDDYVLRRKYAGSGAEIVEAFDGASVVSAQRTGPDAAWTGRVLGTARLPVFNAVFAWCRPRNKPLADEIASSAATTLGWTEVEGIRCVAVLVESDLHCVYELDPARGFAPLRIRIVADSADFPAEDVCGRTIHTVFAFTADDLSDLGGGAWVPRHVESVSRLEGEHRTSWRLVATDHVERARPGDIAGLLGGAGQLEAAHRIAMVRFADGRQWDVPDHDFLGRKVGAWPGPLWSRPWAMALEAACALALAAVVARRLGRRAATAA